LHQKGGDKSNRPRGHFHRGQIQAHRQGANSSEEANDLGVKRGVDRADGGANRQKPRTFSVVRKIRNSEKQ